MAGSVRSAELIGAKLARFAELERLMADPAIYAEQGRARALGSEHAELKPLVDLLERERAMVAERDSARELLTSGDPEMVGMAQAELERIEGLLPAISAEVDELLHPPHPLAHKRAILEVRAGVGGDEAGLFAGELLRAYLRFAERLGFRAEILEQTEGEMPGQLREATVRIDGPRAYDRFRSESGVHRIQRVPVTESQGRIHTSTATVAVLPEADAFDLELRDEDLRIDVYRASGAGGQHVNKTSSAVRVTHLPTGEQVACQSQRSQSQNKEHAMMLLRARLLAHAEEQRRAAEEATRRSQVGRALRSEKVRTYNVPQDRLTDHRLKRSWSNLPEIFEGGLAPVVDAYLAWERAGGVTPEGEDD